MGFDELLLIGEDRCRPTTLSVKQKSFVSKVVRRNANLIHRPDFYNRVFLIDKTEPYFLNKNQAKQFEVLVRREICEHLVCS